MPKGEKHVKEEEDFTTALDDIEIPFNISEYYFSPEEILSDPIPELDDDFDVLPKDFPELKEGHNRCKSIDISRRSQSLSPTRSKRQKVVSKNKSCLHCGTTATPLWRGGPRGEGTLCNACGIRYKAGRLHPEYRPALSPSFVPNVHSNFHKEVMKMRSAKK